METLVVRSIRAERHPREVAPPTLSRTVRDDEVPKVRERDGSDDMGRYLSARWLVVQQLQVSQNSKNAILG